MKETDEMRAMGTKTSAASDVGDTGENGFEKRELFREVAKTKGKRYYFKVRRASNGKKYLVITEGRWQDNQQKYISIFIFEEGLEIFLDALKKTCEQMISAEESAFDANGQ